MFVITVAIDELLKTSSADRIVASAPVQLS